MKKLFFLFTCIAVSITIYSQNNTSSGTQALFNLSSGQDNTAFGYWSMYTGTNMSFNSAFGSWSMYYNKGNFNTGMGGSALFHNNVGYENTAAGYASLSSNTNGYKNLAIGVYALYSNNSYSSTQASLNTAVGYMALYNSTIANNTSAIGAYAGVNSYSGSSNVFVGYGADYNAPTYFVKSVAIGSNTIVTSPYMVRFGDDNIISIGGQVLWSSPSDLRVKKNIHNNVPGLRFINLLEPVLYQFDINSYRKIIGKNTSILGYQDQKDSISEKSKKNKESIQYTGFLAQDVENAAKSIGYDFSGVVSPQNNNEAYGLRYAEFIMPMVKAVQELDFSYDSLQNEIEKLEKNVEIVQNIKNNKSSYSNTQMVKANLNREISAISKIGYSLQNYPNPFSENTTIAYKLPKYSTNISILVFSSDGRLIRQIRLSDSSKQGTVNFDRANIKQGTYSYSLACDGKIMVSQKMVIINK